MSKQHPMCDSCSVEFNKEQWAKYPEMMEVCKMCKSFQESIYETINKHQKVLDKLEKTGKPKI
jgi:hypothetical protein